MWQARPIAAALIAVAFLTVTAIPAGDAAAPWSWSKALATYEVRTHTGGSAACTPIGTRASRVSGTNYYREFVCTVLFTNGASFVLTIEPKTKTVYTLLADNQVSAATATPTTPTYVPPTYVPPVYTTPTLTTPTVTTPTYTVPTTCPSGTYKNVYGNCVPNPTYVPAPPVYGSPTAICNDGTYSYSQTASGTCSYHGGVRTWLRYPG